MAQGRVTDFFATRKRNGDAQPSKRRKIEITASQVDMSSLDITNTNPYRSKTAPAEDSEKTKTVFSPIQTRASRSKAKTTKVTAPKASTRVRKPKLDPKQKLIGDAFKSKTGPETDQTKGELTVADAVTSSWDEHDGPALTPSKSDTNSRNTTKKRGRREKPATGEDEGGATPEKRPTAPPKSETTTKARKRLVLKEAAAAKGLPKENEPGPATPAKEENFSLPKTPPPVSPLPPTPENCKPAAPKEVPMSAAVKRAMEKCKTLKAGTTALKKNAVSADAIKAKLAKCGKLEELKSQLSKMKETSEKLKTPPLKLQKFEEMKVEVEVPREEVKTKAPAYERFHSLAAPAPTLSLPYKYKVLAEMFRGMDTVVSMLHNRNEICTFSKLKAAVQELNKKNFELQHVGQIKTVYPEAYILRQEKGLPMFGKKASGYQMTVEAALQADEIKQENNGRRNFTASQLLTRRNLFHSSLIKIVMKHHKEFLSKLSRPLTIPDEKITRWHPKFPLDQVPDVTPSPLPEAPYVKTYNTAHDVLEDNKGKISPRIAKALTEVAQENAKQPECRPSTPVSSKPTSAAHKGIPLSLLEKIRAKEAMNTASALMRNPKEEKRTLMMKRLPEIMRIMRSHFLTEKKPALPMAGVVQSLADSYKSCISVGEIESHITLMVELVPEWLSLITIKKGKYLKIDRNMDLQALTDKVNNIAKNKK